MRIGTAVFEDIVQFVARIGYLIGAGSLATSRDNSQIAAFRSERGTKASSRYHCGDDVGPIARTRSSRLDLLAVVVVVYVGTAVVVARSWISVVVVDIAVGIAVGAIERTVQSTCSSTLCSY